MAYKNRIRRELFPNENIRHYGVTLKITSKRLSLGEKDHTIFKSDSKLDAFANLEGASEAVNIFARKVGMIQGLYCMTLEPFIIDLKKAIAFNWDEIEPQFLEALKELFVAELDLANDQEIEIDLSMPLPPKPQDPYEILEKLF